MHPFLGMDDGLEDIACLLTTDTGDAGSSPHVARWFFSMMFHDKILLYIYIYKFLTIYAVILYFCSYIVFSLISGVNVSLIFYRGKRAKHLALISQFFEALVGNYASKFSDEIRTKKRKFHSLQLNS